MEKEVLRNYMRKYFSVLQFNMTSSSYNNKLSKVNILLKLKASKRKTARNSSCRIESDLLFHSMITSGSNSDFSGIWVVFAL